MAPKKQIPVRNDVAVEDTWDLSTLYESDDAWEKSFEGLSKKLGGYAPFEGTLHRSAAALARCYTFDFEVARDLEALGTYAFLRISQDVSNSIYVGFMSRYRTLHSRATQLSSFIQPETLTIPAARLRTFMKSKDLEPFRFPLQKLIREKKHVLSPSEERILAMQSESGRDCSKIFSQLNNADLKFGSVKGKKGKRHEITHSSFAALLESPDRKLRKRAFHKFYAGYESHKNTVSSTLAASIGQDIFCARSRGFSSSLETALFYKNIPVEVYDNLVQTVRKRLPAVHRYFDIRRQALGLKKIHFYDTYVPILSKLNVRHTFDEASGMILQAIASLGEEYVNTLTEGLKSRWVDRYENVGKRSGAFSSGTYGGAPYILMSFNEEVLGDVFTLAHEAGHSMHSWYSARNQPFPTWEYTIFVAEVASTFNEKLLSDWMLQRTSDPHMRAFLINREIDAIRGTLVRQTMFAEFEKRTHELAEAGEPLTLDRFRSEYRALLEAYFGPEFAIDDELELECLRIPHLYTAFYVYQYATGISAAIALANRVVGGGPGELNDYLGFLKAGGSEFPLDILKGAGVDMRTPAPIEAAMDRFEALVDELADLLKRL